MLEEICIRRRAGDKFEPGSTLDGRWTIVQSLTHRGSQVSDGCFNRGIKLVEDVSSGNLCVLKMLPPDILCPDHAAREIHLLRSLSQHGGEIQTNLVRFMDSYNGAEHPHDIPWVVTAFCNSGTLAQLVKRYQDEGIRLPEAFLWHVFEGLAKALRFCHSQGVMHRDITLSNVFLHSKNLDDTYPVIQLGDFGCAVRQEGSAPPSVEHLFPGNPGFLPPEGCEAHAASDVYQLGLVVLCLYMANLDPIESLADFIAEGNTHERLYSQKLTELIQWCMVTEMSKRPNAETCWIRTKRQISGGPPLLGNLVESQSIG